MSAAIQPARRLFALVTLLTVWALIALPLLVPSFRCPSVVMSHRPCPGCGMTRAMLALFDGQVRGSLALHPLALPTSLAYAGFALASVLAAWRMGSPVAAFEDRWGRRALFFLMGVMTLNFLLWIARGCGALGGPVPV